MYKEQEMCIRKENDIDRLSAFLEDIEEIGRIHLYPDHQTQDLQCHSGQAQEKQANEHNHAERSVQGTGMYSGGCSALCAGRKGEGGLTAEENCGAERRIFQIRSHAADIRERRSAPDERKKEKRKTDPVYSGENITGDGGIYLHRSGDFPCSADIREKQALQQRG